MREWGLILLVLVGLFFHSEIVSASINSRDVFIAFNNENGRITNNIVSAVARDPFGFVWIGTNNGLNRLDGYSTINYVNDPKNQNSISSNFIQSLFIDNDGDLWIGTIGGGVNLYDRKNDQFIHITPNTQSENTKSGINVAAILQDHKGYIWIGTNGNVINRYNKKTGIFKSYQLNPLDKGNSNIRVMYCDASNNIWFGFDFDSNGIYRIDGKTEEVTFYAAQKIKGNATNLGPIRGIVQLKNGNILVGTWNGRVYLVSTRGDQVLDLICDESFFGNASITHMICDNEGNIFVGTWEHGLFLLSEDFKILKRYTKDKTRLSSIRSNAINVLYIDSQNNLWVAHRNSGISLLSLDKPLFQTLPIELNGQSYPDDIDVQSFVKDSTGNIWFATRGQGLWRYNLSTQKLKQYTSSSHKGLTTNYLLTLILGKDGKMWIGTDGKFIICFDPVKEKFTQFDFKWGDWSSVFSIVETDDYLWCGTWGNGIKKVDKKSMDVSTINFEMSDQFKNTIFDLELCDSNLWVANIGIGLFRININTGDVKLEISTESEKSDLFNMRINDIYIEDSSRIWVSTAGGGAARYNPQTGNYIIFNKKNGFNDDVIQTVIADKHNNYWFSTLAGLTVLRNQLKDPVNFFTHNGLLNNALNKSAAFYDKEEDIIYLGTQFGVNYFNPNQINIDSIVNKVIFTELSVMGKEVPRTSNPIIDGPTELAQTITLLPNQKVFEITFSSMDFTPSFLNSYEYKLDGFDKEWIYTPFSKNFAQYTNLDPGVYTFKVKTVNHNGIGSDAISAIKVVVKPAFHQTFIFRMAFVLLIIGAIVLFIRIRFRNLRIAKETLEQNVALRTLEIEQQKVHIEKQNKMLEESNASKDRFFTIIGHDLNNPMSNIDQMLELLEMEYESMPTETVSLMIKHLRISSEHTLDLLRNLITWAKTQTNRIKIEKQPISISDLFSRTQQVCEFLARQKGQVLKFSTDETCVGFFDDNTISTVLRNLITNAIKFSKPNDVITIASKIDLDKIVISVQDKGVGMAKKDVDNLFKVESMKSGIGTKGETGTGLGLILCFEFVTLNGGTIWVKSEPSVGTTFFFSLDRFTDTSNV